MTAMPLTNRYRTIPECRRDLLEISIDPRMPEDLERRIRLVVRQMYRRKAIRRTRIRSARITPAMRQRIREMFFANPDMSMQTIGDNLGVNMGRVSENTAGFR